MAAVEERMDHLELALASYLATDERIRRESEAGMRESRERHARVDAQLLAMQQKADAQFLAWQQKADKDREKADKDREGVDAQLLAWRQAADSKSEQVDAQLLAWRQAADSKSEQVNAQLLAMRQEADRKSERVDAQFLAWRVEFHAWLEKADKERRDFNKRMAELSDSMGTLVEDMVAPNGERIAGQIFPDDPVQFELQRLRRRKGGESMELDLVVAGSRHAMVVEAKRTIRPEDPDAFLEKLKRFKEFFPEYAAHQIIPVMASINIEPSIVSNLNKRKVYGLAFGDETFELINLNQF